MKSNILQITTNTVLYTSHPPLDFLKHENIILYRNEYVLSYLILSYLRNPEGFFYAEFVRFV